MVPTVLIVDDDEQIVLSLLATLEGIPNLEVLAVRDAGAALRIVRDDACKVAALITDLGLPVVDGCSLIRQIRAVPGCRTLPVLMITADEHAGFGADGSGEPNILLKKPFSYREVRRVVEQMLESSAADSLAGDDLSSADVSGKRKENP